MGRVSSFLNSPSTPQGRFCLHWNHPARPHKVVKGVAARTALARGQIVQRTSFIYLLPLQVLLQLTLALLSCSSKCCCCQCCC